jgi:hypothetical protein
MLFQQRNFWPFLISCGIQNPLMGIWTSLLARQPSFSTSLTFFAKVWQVMLALPCQLMAQSPDQVHGNDVSSMQQEAREAFLQ